MNIQKSDYSHALVKWLQNSIENKHAHILATTTKCLRFLGVALAENIQGLCKEKYWNT